jgi:outer membrane lipoprotein SlyB
MPLRSVRLLAVLPLVALLAACGSDPAGRTITGAALGAGAGAAIGSFSGNAGLGAVIGGTAGGLLGAMTNQNQVNAGPSPFDRPAPRVCYDRFGNAFAC